MHPDHLEELTHIFSQLEFSTNEFHFRKKCYHHTDENVVDILTAVLYSECYAKKKSVQLLGETLWMGNTENEYLFIDQLSANNCTEVHIENGWTVKNVQSNGFMELGKSAIKKIVALTAYIKAGPSDIPNINQVISITLPKEDRWIQQGFYYVYSNEPFDAFQPMVRIYWNTDSAGAILLVKAITQQLNLYHIPFIFKCLNHPAAYTRRDPCVLYLSKKYYTICSWLLDTIEVELKNHLYEDVPLFAYKHSNGIGIAENPLTNESFGMNRMKMVAEALIGFSKENDGISATDSIKNAFIKRGIDFNTAYLNKGSKQNFLNKPA